MCVFRRWWRFDAPRSAVRFGVALILFAAAVLKTHQLATEPIVAPGLLESRPFLVLVVQFELLLAFWLVSGLALAASWWVSLVTFAAFAVVASGKGIAGEALCGCFGRIPTSPWFSFWLDVCVLGALCTSRVPGWRWNAPLASIRAGAVAEALRGLRNVRRAAGRPAAACLIAAWLLAAPVLGIAGFRGARSRDLAGLGQRVGAFIIVQPERMVGHRFVLGEHIDIGDRLAEGRWLLVFYRDGCPGCQTLGEIWERIAARLPPGVRPALIAVSGSTAIEDAPVADVLLGALDQDKQWFVATPLVLALNENYVLGVTEELAALETGVVTELLSLERR